MPTLRGAVPWRHFLPALLAIILISLIPRAPWWSAAIQGFLYATVLIIYYRAGTHAATKGEAQCPS